MTSSNALPLTGRCYCGHLNIAMPNPPRTVAYCHCNDCRRWTGAPVAAFASFDIATLQATPDLGRATSHAQGVTRWNCPKCSSPIAATFEYLPGQIYVPLGIIDQANSLPPKLHCHAGSCHTWLNINDELPRHSASGRDTLNTP